MADKSFLKCNHNWLIVEWEYEYGSDAEKNLPDNTLRTKKATKAICYDCKLIWNIKNEDV